MIINDPSVINIPITQFGEQIDELYRSGVRYFHIDIMDGHYVPNICFPLNGIKAMREKYPDAVLEVHLMVDDPQKYIPQMKQMGADYFGFHIDATRFVRRTLTEIREAGMKAGVVINPSQRVDLIEPFIDHLDHVIFMSVEPGFAGQKFLPGSMERLAELNTLRKEKNANFQIIVDGGIHYGIIEECIENGADAFVTNVFTVFNQPEGIFEACKKFENFCREAERKLK